MAAVPELDPTAVASLGERLAANIRQAVKVDERVLREVLVALFAEGHVLIGEVLMRAPDPEAAVRELTRSEEPTQA